MHQHNEMVKQYLIDSSEAVRGRSSFQRLNLWGIEKEKLLFPMDNFIKIFPLNRKKR